MAEMLEQMGRFEAILVRLGGVGSVVEVVSITKASPFCVAVRVGTSVPKSGGGRRLLPQKSVPKRLSSLMAAASRNAELPSFADERLASDLFKLVSSLSSSSTEARIQVGSREHALDDSILSRLKRELAPKTRSHTSYTGRLERINTHGRSWSFFIYPVVGPPRIKCVFAPELVDHVKPLVRSVVRVRGIATYAAKEKWPEEVLVQRIEDIEEVPPAPPGAWTSLLDDLRSHWIQATEEERALVQAGVQLG